MPGRREANAGDLGESWRFSGNRIKKRPQRGRLHDQSCKGTKSVGTTHIELFMKRYKLLAQLVLWNQMNQRAAQAVGLPDFDGG